MATAAASISPHIVALVVLGLVRARRGDPGRWARSRRPGRWPSRPGSCRGWRRRAGLAELPAGLTARELEVLTLLGSDLRNADIAARLHISDKTVDHHVSAILAKLGVRSRREAARVAAQRQLLHGDGNERRQDREPAARSWGPAPDVTDRGLLDTPTQPHHRRPSGG